VLTVIIHNYYRNPEKYRTVEKKGKVSEFHYQESITVCIFVSVYVCLYLEFTCYFNPNIQITLIYYILINFMLILSFLINGDLGYFHDYITIINNAQ
jgi:hypothetical protein